MLAGISYPSPDSLELYRSSGVLLLINVRFLSGLHRRGGRVIVQQKTVQLNSRRRSVLMFHRRPGHCRRDCRLFMTYLV